MEKINYENEAKKSLKISQNENQEFISERNANNVINIQNNSNNKNNHNNKNISHKI